LGFVHRRVGDRDVYFVSNTSNRPVVTKATFRANAAAQVWDPLSGTVSNTGRIRISGTSTLDVDLPPYASTFYVFSGAPPTSPFIDPPSRVRGNAGGVAGGPGGRLEGSAPDQCEPRGGVVDVASGWQLDIPDVGLRALTALTSWHEQPDLRFYSGVVTYRRDVEIAPTKLSPMLSAGCGIWLDFGAGTARPEEKLTNGMRAWLDAPVREGARVLVNGQDVGAVWAPPYRLNVTKALRPGRNAFELRVGNTALNRWAARPHPDYKLLHLRYGKRFDPQDTDKIVPQPSGIIGAPRLIY